ncbi:MAG: MmcQ/YjbR family DNA-binding protein [Bacteroidales bacterium]
MDIVKIREYCLGKPGVSECFPFDEETLVFKVKDKIFALVSLDGAPGLNLKCDPALALELREKYSSVTPGYHMNKKHWNTVNIDGTIPDKEILGWIDHSYDLVSGKK